MHSIEVGITVQGEDLNQLRFSCILEFTSFSSSSLLLLLSSGNSIGFNSSSLYSGSPTWPNKKSSLLILEPPLSKLPSALIWRKGFYVHQRWSSKSQYVLSVSYLQEWYHHFLCDFKNCWLWPLYFGNGFIKKIISSKCCYFGLNSPFSKQVLAFSEAVQSNLYIYIYDGHSWHQLKVVALGKWLSYKTPLVFSHNNICLNKICNCTCFGVILQD